jgi:hypothetical protein
MLNQRMRETKKHTISQICILKHIERSKLCRINALHAQDLNRGTRETALWRLWCALHKQHYWCRGHSLVDYAACRIGEVPDLEGCEELRSCWRD